MFLMSFIYLSNMFCFVFQISFHYAQGESDECSSFVSNFKIINKMLFCLSMCVFIFMFFLEDGNLKNPKI